MRHWRIWITADPHWIWRQRHTYWTQYVLGPLTVLHARPHRNVERWIDAVMAMDRRGLDPPTSLHQWAIGSSVALLILGGLLALWRW